MGVGMQIVYLGFCGSAHLEAEAAAQLIRLEHFSAIFSNCYLAIEATHTPAGIPWYDVRLDLITPAHELKPIGHCASEDVEEAIRCAFGSAAKALRIAFSMRREGSLRS